jgi:glycine/D-amino acid oxidase-like deaminating enzyme
LNSKRPSTQYSETLLEIQARGFKMTKTKIPVGLPHPDPTKAYWQTPPLPIADHRTTPHLPPLAKYVIVGSGVSGASIAWKLYQEKPCASIVMLEARQACSGATGRNGGHCRAGRYLSFKNDLDNFGEHEALLMEKLEEDNVKNVGEFIKTHGIDCDLRDVETLDVFTDQKKLDHAFAALKARKGVLEGHVTANVLTKHKIWSEKETREELLIPEGVGAISYPAYKLSPYKFVCGVLEMCLKKGLNLQTNTPVVEVSQAPTHDGKRRWLVHTDRGIISAETVILGKYPQSTPSPVVSVTGGTC